MYRLGTEVLGGFTKITAWDALATVTTIPYSNLNKERVRRRIYWAHPLGLRTSPANQYFQEVEDEEILNETFRLLCLYSILSQPI